MLRNPPGALTMAGIEDPLTDDEQAQVNRNIPVLSANPPGIDLGSVLNRFRDSIVSYIAASAGIAFTYYQYTGVSDIISSLLTWEPVGGSTGLGGFPASGSPTLTVPQDGTYLCVYTAGICRNAVSSVSDYQTGFSIDGGVPASNTENGIDFTTTNKHRACVNVKVLSLLAGQTIRANARKVSGSGNLNLNTQTTLIVRLGA